MKTRGGLDGTTTAATDKKAAARDRVRKHREGLRARGLRPVQVWVPDVQSPELLAEIRRQCLALRDDPEEREVLEFIERAMDYSGWE